MPKKEQLPKIQRESAFTDVFKRKTVYIEENLLGLLQKLSKSRKGEQTRIIDAALRQYLSDPENIKKHVRNEDWWTELKMTTKTDK